MSDKRREDNISKDPLDTLLERRSDDNEAQTAIYCIMEMAEKEFLFFRDNADSLDDFYSIRDFDFDSRRNKLFAIRRFSTINVDTETNNKGGKPYIIVKPYTFQRAYSLLLTIQKMFEESISLADIFLIYHRLERHGRPKMSLKDQYDNFKSGMFILNRLYLDNHIEIHEVKWYDEDPGINADLSWDEELEMKEYIAEERRETYLGIDLEGIFSRIEQDKTYASSLFSDIGWIEGSDGLLHKENFMVDIHTGQRWKWAWHENPDWDYYDIDYPELLG